MNIEIPLNITLQKDEILVLASLSDFDWHSVMMLQMSFAHVQDVPDISRTLFTLWRFGLLYRRQEILSCDYALSPFGDEIRQKIAQQHQKVRIVQC